MEKDNFSYRKAVFIVTYAIENEKIFYVVLKRHKHWNGFEFPKGGIEENEDLEKTVKREILEETGLKARNILDWKIYGKYKYGRVLADRSKFIGQTFHLFSAEVNKKEIKVDNMEHDYGEWLDFEKAIKKLTHSNQKKCLIIINNWLKKAKNK